MSEQNNSANNVVKQNAESRLQYLLEQVIANQEVWILADEHGCVMLNTDEEDCIPVWPSQEFAQSWATEEWKACEAEAIPLSKWFSHWITGLSEDELAIVIFPDENNEGLVLYPEELEGMLQKKIAKLAR